jgi:hypothetical protein
MSDPGNIRRDIQTSWFSFDARRTTETRKT